MNKYKVELKSTTYREVEVEAKDEDTAVDLVVDSLSGVATPEWLENAEAEDVEILQMDLETFYAWLQEAPGTRLDDGSVDYMQDDEGDVTFLNFEGEAVYRVTPLHTIKACRDKGGRPYIQLSLKSVEYVFEVRRMMCES